MRNGGAQFAGIAGFAVSFEVTVGVISFLKMLQNIQILFRLKKLLHLLVRFPGGSRKFLLRLFLLILLDAGTKQGGFEILEFGGAILLEQAAARPHLDFGQLHRLPLVSQGSQQNGSCR